MRRDHLLHGFDSELSSAVKEGMLGKASTCVSPPALSPSKECQGISLCPRKLESGCPAVVSVGDRSTAVPGRTQPASRGHHRGRASVPVNADQCTNVSHVFAVGDVTDRICLTPVAIDEGRAFADSTYGQRPRQVNHELVASAVFVNRNWPRWVFRRMRRWLASGRRGW